MSNVETAICERSRDPEGVRIVRRALSDKSSALLEHRLEEVGIGGCDLIDIDMPDSNGDTALHLIAKSTPFTGFHQDLMELLLRHGALPNVKDKRGRMPHEYLMRSTLLWTRFPAALENPEEGFKGRVKRLKEDGNEAHRQKRHADAVEKYEKAVTLIEQSPYKMSRDLAILYSNMATVYAKLSYAEKSCAMAQKSIQHDPQYHKPYWQLAKNLAEDNRWVGACYIYLLGAGCTDTDNKQKAIFLTEICSLFSSLTESQIDGLIVDMRQNLSACWPEVAETLTRNASWDAVRRLVLGPPEVLVDKSQVDHRWRFADRFTDGEQLKVGYALCLKANTPVLSTLVEVVEQKKVAGVYEWATDLTLALLLQGAQLQTLATGSEKTCYLVAVHLCCLTEKLGLLRYILSDDTTMQEARSFVNYDRQTLLHTVCLHFGDGNHAVGRQLVQLLMEKGFDPIIQDIFRKRPGDYLPPQSPMALLLASSPEEGFKGRVKRLKEDGNEAHRQKRHADAVEKYEKAVTLIEQSPYKMARDLAILFSNMATAYANLSDAEKSCAMAQKSIQHDPQYHKPYWRLAKNMTKQKRWVGACYIYLLGAGCTDTDNEQKAEFLTEICSLFSSLTESQIEGVIVGMRQYLSACWPEVAETLTRKASWDAMRRLVLGPPEVLVDKSQVDLKWRFADRFTDGTQLKVGYAMCLKANTPVLSTLVEVVKQKKVAGVHEWATDLVLALLLQGAQLQTLATGGEETCYHVALNLCCWTEKLGLLRYILSDDAAVEEARSALDKRDKRTLLHTVCRHFSDGNHAVSRQLVQLLMEKGFDPKVQDIHGKRPENFLAPKSPLTLLLARSPAQPPTAMDDWRQAVANYFPEWETTTCCVPPIHFNRPSYTTDHVAGQPVLVQQPAVKSDAFDDFSQQHVMHCLRALGHKQGEPMCLISQLDYSDILKKVKPHKKQKKEKKGKASSRAACDQQLPRHVDLPERDRNGDFDLLDAHLRHGIVIGEIKAVGLDGAKDDDVVSKRVKHAVQQLEKSGRVLAYLLSDIAPGVRIVKTIILPYIASQQLERVLKADTELLQVVCATLDVSPPDVTKAVGLCLLKDQLSHQARPHDVTDHTLTQLSGWFRRRVSAAVDPTMTTTVYLDILARLVGPASTVTVHCITPPRVEVRTLGEAVSVLGERLARFVLTPAQFSLLNRVDSLPRVCLVGPPGTGKTIMLVLVGLHWLREGHNVLVLSTWDGSLNVSRVIVEQLEQTLRNDPTPLAGTVRLHESVLTDRRTDPEALVQQLVATATDHTLHILMDEIDLSYSDVLSHIVATLCGRVRELRLWAATMFSKDILPELHVETLTVPLRSTPTIVREISPTLDKFKGCIPSYTDSGVPLPSDGSTVIRLRHEGGQHAGREPLQCQQCGREVAHVLHHQLRVGLTGPGSCSPSPPPLQYKDVIVLTRDLCLQDEKRDTSGQVVMAGSDFVFGLRDEGIPVAFGRRGLSEAERTNKVTVTNLTNVFGLEKKVVVVLPGRGEGADEGTSVDELAEEFLRLQLVSRCSTQLVTVDIPAADVLKLMHHAWLIRHFEKKTIDLARKSALLPRMTRKVGIDAPKEHIWRALMQYYRYYGDI